MATLAALPVCCARAQAGPPSPAAAPQGVAPQSGNAGAGQVGCTPFQWISNTCPLANNGSPNVNVDGAPLALGFEPGQTIFTDNFQTLDPAWGADDSSSAVHNGAMEFKPAVDQEYRRYSEKYALTDVDAAVTVVASSTTQGGGAAGFAIWADAAGSLTNFLIDPVAGEYAIYAITPSKQTPIVDWNGDNSINTAPNASNRIEVISTSTQTRFLVNGHPVATIATPSNLPGPLIGLVADSPDGSPGDYFFTDLMVKQALTDLPGLAAEAPSASPGQTIYSDNFGTLDPSWGFADQSLSVGDGLLRDALTAKNTSLELNDKYVYGSADESVDVAVAPADDPMADGALVFWGADSNDFTYFYIIPKNRTFAVVQTKNGVGAFLIDEKTSDAINATDGASNHIEVALRAGEAYLFVNGRNVGELSAPTGLAPSLVGLLAENRGPANSTVCFANFSVAAPVGSGSPIGTAAAATPASAPCPPPASAAPPSSVASSTGVAPQTPPPAASPPVAAPPPNFSQSAPTPPPSQPQVSIGSVAPPPAQAPGPGETVILSDNFQTFSPLWGKPDKTVFVQNGVLVAQLSGASVATRLNTAYRYYDADISFDEQVASGPAGSGVDLMFWLQDTQHYYYLFVGADGAFRVTQVSGTTLTTIVPPQTSAAIKGVGQWNVVKLSIRGNAAALSVNGAPLVQFAGNPPIFGGPVGLSGAGGAGGPSTIEFANFQVAAPTPAHLTLGPVNVSTAAPVRAPASVGDNPVLEDDFLTFAPSWGGGAGVVSVVGGNLQELAANGAVAGVVNSRYLYADADIRYNLQLEQTAQQADTVASLFFWISKGNTDQYILSVSPAGYARVFHRIGAQTQNLTPWVAATGFSQGVGQVNTIDLSLRGNQGAVSVDGRTVAQFSGSAPPGGGTIGFAMLASKSGASSWNFSKLQIWVPTAAVAGQ